MISKASGGPSGSPTGAMSASVGVPSAEAGPMKAAPSRSDAPIRSGVSQASF